MRSLIPASTLGIVSFFFLDAYSELYSISLLIWSVVFVEWWRIKERKLAVHWGVRGADAVETSFRAEFRPDNDSWWKQELKMIASLPVIAIFGVLLVGLMTLIFVVESFLVLLYEGPGQDYAVGFELFAKSRFILIVSNSIALCLRRYCRLSSSRGYSPFIASTLSSSRTGRITPGNHLTTDHLLSNHSSSLPSLPMVVLRCLLSCTFRTGRKSWASSNLPSQSFTFPPPKVLGTRGSRNGSCSKSTAMVCTDKLSFRARRADGFGTRFSHTPSRIK